MPSENPQPADGQAATEKLMPYLKAIAAKDVLLPTIDPQAAAVKVLGMMQTLKSEGADVVARLKALPKSEFDASKLDLLEPAARALLQSRAELASMQAAATGAKVPVSLLEQGQELKDRMMRLIDYHLGDVADNGKADGEGSVASELADIRKGTGYLDLASDLVRLAALHRKNTAELDSDKKLFRATDPDDAVAVAGKIQDCLGTSAALTSNPAKDLAARSWTLLKTTYDDVVMTGRWLLRNEDRGARLFPRLHTGSRHTRRGSSSS